MRGFSAHVPVETVEYTTMSENGELLDSASSHCSAVTTSTDDVNAVGDNNASTRALAVELRKEMIRFYRSQYKHDIIVSLWETYQAFLANESDQAYRQDADDAMGDLSHASQEETIRAIGKYRRLACLYNRQTIGFEMGYRLVTKLPGENMYGGRGAMFAI